MGVVTLRYGCPVCNTDVTGNNQIHFLCGRCGVLYDPRLIRTKHVRRELMTRFIEYVKSPEGDVFHVHTCKYAKRIEYPVTIQHADTHGLRACKCVGDTHVDP